MIVIKISRKMRVLLSAGKYYSLCRVSYVKRKWVDDTWRSLFVTVLRRCISIHIVIDD